MKKRFFFKLIILFLAAVTVLSCSVKTEKNVKTEKRISCNNVLNIEVHENEIGNTHFVKNAKYVFLEEEYLIGKVGRIILSDKKIFIQDELTNCIAVYSDNGKFLFLIDKNGKGPLEYLKITDFTLNKSNNTIIILDRKLQKLLTYSINDKKIVEEQKIHIYPTALACSSNDIFFYNPYTINYKNKDLFHFSLLKASKHLNKIERYFKVNSKMGNFMSNPHKLGFYYGEKLYFKNRFENKIYSMEKDSVNLHANIIFADNIDYDKALDNAIIKGTRNIERYNRCSGEVHGYSETKDLISFRYRRNHKKYSLLFSKNKEQIVFHKEIYEMFSPHLFRKEIPLFLYPSYVYGEDFVSIIPYKAMRYFSENKNFITQMKEYMNNKELAFKFQNYGKNANPVIAIYRFDI